MKNPYPPLDSKGKMIFMKLTYGIYHLVNKEKTLNGAWNRWFRRSKIAIFSAAFGGRKFLGFETLKWTISLVKSRFGITKYPIFHGRRRRPENFAEFRDPDENKGGLLARGVPGVT